MNVFDILQPRFFNLLASNSSSRLHSDCLLQIYHVYDREIAFKLDRASVRASIAAYLMDIPPQEDGEETYASPNEYANAILRRFVEAGWLEEDVDDVTYEHQIQMTEHGIALAEFLSGILHPQMEEYSSIVFNIYNTLCSEAQWNSDPYVYALKAVYGYAKQLANSLKKLSTNMKSIIEKLVEEESLESLTQNLMEYCEGSFIREYSRLTKQQNMHLYRSEIQKRLEQMKSDASIYELIVIGCFTEENCDTEEEAEEKVFNMFQMTLQFLTDDYDRIMYGIKKKINIYFNLAVGRARFLANHDSNTKGSVEQMLRYLIQELSTIDEKSELPDELMRLFQLYSNEFIDLHSLRYPSKRRMITAPTQIDVPELTDEDLAKGKENIRKAAFDPYSKERIKQYTEKIMGARTEIEADAFSLTAKGDVLALAAVIAYAHENGFEVETKDSYLETDGFIIRNFTLYRKAGEA